MKALILAAALCALGTSATAADTPAAKPVLPDYGKLPAVENMRLSPSGDRVAFIGVDGETRKVVVNRVAGGTLVALRAGDSKVRDLKWLSEHDLMMETSRSVHLDPSTRVAANDEYTVSAIIDTDTGKNFPVFAGQPKILAATFGFYGASNHGDKSYGYFGGLTLEGDGDTSTDFGWRQFAASHNHPDLYRVDLETGDALKIAGGSDRHGTDWLVDPSGRIVAHAEYDRQGVWRLYRGVLGLVGAVATVNSPTGDVDLMGFGQTPGTALVFGPIGEDGELAYREYALETDAAGRDPFRGALIKWPIYAADTRLLLGAVTNEDDPRTVMVDPSLQAKFDKVAKALAGESVALVSANSTLDRMILRAEGPVDSGTYYFVDYPSRKIEAIAWDYPTILQGAVAESRIVAYKASDGLEMQGVLTLPSGRPAKSLPLVVMPHGGPEERDYKGFNWWAQAFASRGYAVFQPNFRGSAGFSRAFREAGYGELGRKMQTDISDGVAELAREGIVDPKRACIVGASYGGYAALAGVTVQHGLYRCAVSVGGISDLNMLLADTADAAGEHSADLRSLRKFLGVSGDGARSLDARSPRKLASRADAPILLMFGEDDSVVPINQSRDFGDALRAAGKPYQMVQLRGEDHFLSREATRIRMLEASVAFVEENNPPS
ncbi:MAG TPA: alpha/beta fold hydrolase [Caulobacteraceae bacterium]|jgi:dipeptidyl aminopeptidase/acylaminoacyl peptidase|nr:alpha/beta fold hydrolase [Caulobacteraceae bacterium]